MCNIARLPCSQSCFKIQILYEIIETEIKDCFDIKRCTHIWPTDQILVFISQQVINNVDFNISLENLNFEDQMIEVKIRDHCDMRRCTQIRPTE